MYHMLP